MDRTNRINRPSPKKRTSGKAVIGTVLKVLAVILTAIVILAVTLLISLKMICSTISPAAQRMFVTTILET